MSYIAVKLSMQKLLKTATPPQPFAGRRQSTDRSPLVGFCVPWVLWSLVTGPGRPATVTSSPALAAQALNAFYRIDQIYEVLEEARAYEGELSILEFGTRRRGDDSALP